MVEFFKKNEHAVVPASREAVISVLNLLGYDVAVYEMSSFTCTEDGTIFPTIESILYINFLKTFNYVKKTTTN